MQRIISAATACGLIVIALLANSTDASAGHCGSPPNAWGRSGSSAYASWCSCMRGSYDPQTTTCSGASHRGGRPPPPPTPQQLSGQSYNHGNYLSGRGDLDGAIKAYLAALKYDPRNADAMNNLALVYKRKGWYRLGINLLRQALRIRPVPGYRRNLLNQMKILGDRLIDQKLYGEAEQWFRSILGMDPNNASALNEGMSRLLLKFVQQALLVEQATQPWPSVQGRG